MLPFFNVSRVVASDTIAFGVQEQVKQKRYRKRNFKKTTSMYRGVTRYKCFFCYLFFSATMIESVLLPLYMKINRINSLYHVVEGFLHKIIEKSQHSP